MTLKQKYTIATVLSFFVMFALIVANLGVYSSSFLATADVTVNPDVSVADDAGDGAGGCPSNGCQPGECKSNGYQCVYFSSACSPSGVWRACKQSAPVSKPSTSTPPSPNTSTSSTTPRCSSVTGWITVGCGVNNCQGILMKRTVDNRGQCVKQVQCDTQSAQARACIAKLTKPCSSVTDWKNVGCEGKLMVQKRVVDSSGSCKTETRSIESATCRKQVVTTSTNTNNTSTTTTTEKCPTRGTWQNATCQVVNDTLKMLQTRIVDDNGSCKQLTRFVDSESCQLAPGCNIKPSGNDWTDLGCYKNGCEYLSQTTVAYDGNSCSRIKRCLSNNRAKEKCPDRTQLPTTALAIGAESATSTSINANSKPTSNSQNNTCVIGGREVPVGASSSLNGVVFDCNSNAQPVPSGCDDSNQFLSGDKCYSKLDAGRRCTSNYQCSSGLCFADAQNGGARVCAGKGDTSNLDCEGSGDSQICRNLTCLLPDGSKLTPPSADVDVFKASNDGKTLYSCRNGYTRVINTCRGGEVLSEVSPGNFDCVRQNSLAIDLVATENKEEVVSKIGAERVACGEGRFCAGGYKCHTDKTGASQCITSNCTISTTGVVSCPSDQDRNLGFQDEDSAVCAVRNNSSVVTSFQNLDAVDEDAWLLTDCVCNDLNSAQDIGAADFCEVRAALARNGSVSAMCINEYVNMLDNEVYNQLCTYTAPNPGTENIDSDSEFIAYVVENEVASDAIVGVIQAGTEAVDTSSPVYLPANCTASSSQSCASPAPNLQNNFGPVCYVTVTDIPGDYITGSQFSIESGSQVPDGAFPLNDCSCLNSFTNECLSRARIVGSGVPDPF